LEVNAMYAGVGVQADDVADLLPNRNGIYRISVWVADEQVFDCRFVEIAFEDTRGIYAHSDYLEHLRQRYVHRCYRLPGNRLPIYGSLQRDGVIPLGHVPVPVRVCVADVAGNTAELRLWLRRSAVVVASANNESYNYVLPYREESIVRDTDMSVWFPAGSLYQDLYFRYHRSVDNSRGMYSATYHLHQADKVPLHRPLRLAIVPQQLPDHLRDKAIIVQCGGGMRSFGGEWHGDSIVAMVNELGAYCVMVDTSPPVNFRPGYALGYQRRISFKVADGLSGLRRVRGYVNDHWVLFEHDGKSGTVTYTVDEAVQVGANVLRLVAEDKCGNETVYTGTFYR
jgi:hypothetical protein